jgi:hypothetical protein
MATIRGTPPASTQHLQRAETRSTNPEQARPQPAPAPAPRQQDTFVSSGTQGTRGNQAASPAVLLAQAQPAPLPQQRFNVQTPFGNVRVRITENDYQAPDTGRNHRLNVLEIKRGDPQTRADFSSMGNQSDIDRLINQAAGWVNSNARMSSLPGFRPETAQVTVGDNGVASMQRWMSNGQEGRLVSVSVRDPRLGEGFIEVPPAVLTALPEGRGRDVTRDGGTQYTLRTAPVERNGRRENATFWEASYQRRNERTQELERVTLQFTPGDHRLGLVTTQRPNGAISYDFREGFDRLPGPRNNLSVASGSQVTYFGDGAQVRNQAGTLRELYAKTGEGQYRLDVRGEHILQNGQSTDLRLLYRPQEQRYALARETNGSMQVLREQLETTRDGQPILPRELLNGLDPATLSAPVSRLSVSAGGRPATGPLQPRLVNLDYGRFQYSQLNGSPAERFRDPNAPFQQRNVVINGQQRQMDLLDAGAQNRYVDRQGVEYFARNENGVLHVENVNPTSVIGTSARAYALPEGTFIVPSGGARARDLIPRLAAMGLEPVGILGTGFIGSEDLDGANGVSDAEARHKNAVGYSYFDPSKLGITQNIPAADRTSGAFDRRTGGIFREGGVIRENGLGSDNIHAGYYTTFSRDARGQLTFQNHRLEYPDTGNTDRNAIRAAMGNLERRPDVIAINLFAHHSSESVDELVGIMPSEGDTGTSNVADTDADRRRTGILDSRAMMVYDNSGNQLGMLFVPKMAIRDTLEAARQAYNRQDVQVQNMDGDFYAQAWFADGRDESSNYALNYQNAFIVVRPTEGFRPAAVPPSVTDPSLDAQFQRGLDDDDREDIRQRTGGIPIIDDLIRIFSR